MEVKRLRDEVKRSEAEVETLKRRKAHYEGIVYLKSLDVEVMTSSRYFVIYSISHTFLIQNE
jgi:hypothetical protein